MLLSKGVTNLVRKHEGGDGYEGEDGHEGGDGYEGGDGKAKAYAMRTNNEYYGKGVKNF